MNYAKEFGYAGHMLPILINYHSSHIDILRDNSIDDHSYTYKILFPYPLVDTGDMHRY